MLRDTNNKIQDRMYTLAGLENALNERSEDSELMEYFMCNKNLSVMKVSGTTIEFVAHGDADMYDEEAFEQYVGNHTGFLYRDINPDISPEQMEMFYCAIFGGDYKLRLCAAYTADFRTGLKAFSNYPTFPPESSTYFPNPHIQQFGCIGTYAKNFQEYMRKRDYIGAIDQATVSARTLNFHDSGVIARLAQNLSYTTIKCIESPTGELLTPLEAIKELEGGNGDE